jgi:uncharacterized membrane-anchored protein YhcB (DUF1043 family)
MRRENEKMATIDEVNQFITTDEGKAWLDQQKASLLEHRDQVLSELKKTSGEYSELKQRFEETENTLKSEKAVTSKYLIDSELTRLLRQANVFDEAIPRTIETLKTAYGLTVKAIGNDRTAIGVLKDKDGKDAEAALEAVVAAWAKEPDAKYFIRCGNTGGGAAGGSHGGQSAPALNRLSGQALASMTDEQFKTARNNALNSAKE